MIKNIFYISVIFFLLAISVDLKAQDVFGRAKNPDTTYLNADDFNVGEVITVDTSGGSNIFIGTDIASALNTPDKMVFVILDTAASGTMAHKVISSSIVDTLFVLENYGDGNYTINFAAGIFENKRVVIKVGQSPVVFSGNLFDPSISLLGYIYFFLEEVTSSSFPFVTINESGNVAQGILQPNTIIEITLYPL